MSLLEVAGLRKSYGALVAVDAMSFTVQPKEIFGLLGPNGAGKSTTLMMLAGLIEPDAGTISLDGKILDSQDRQSRRYMGIVPQDLAIYPNLSARENLAFFGRLYGVRGAQLKQRIDEVLAQTGLTDRADDLTSTYSGGMKRRLNFGAALLHQPRLLILDEPTVGVDPQSRAHLLNCVRDLCAGGTSVIYCSHYMEEVQELCDRVAIVDRGHLLACDHIDHLLGRLGHEVRLHVMQKTPVLADRLSGLDGVSVAQHNSQDVITIQCGAPEDGDKLAGTLASVLRTVQETGAKLQTLEAERPNLERLFLQMTGSRLRD